MKTKNKAGFGVDDKPDVEFLAVDLNDCFVGMPFIRVKIESGHQREAKGIKQGCKVSAPIADGSMRDGDIKSDTKDKSNITVRVFAQIKHGKSRNDEMNGITHAFEVRFAKQSSHGGWRHSQVLDHKE